MDHPLKKYLLSPDPGKRASAYRWAVGIGLQKVDGLEVSEYLIDTACRDIEGDLGAGEAARLAGAYYESKAAREKGSGAREQDLAAARIAELLAEPAFVFSPAGLLETHRRIFAAIFDHAGEARTFNITKNEWCLNGASAVYAPASEIMAALRYDIDREKRVSYLKLDTGKKIERLAAFIADLWQIHPFQEGNTRASAVFLIKRLRSLGFDADNSLFMENSWYFRNALVRANATDLAAGYEADYSYLRKFLENLLMGQKHNLKNRDLRIGETSE